MPRTRRFVLLSQEEIIKRVESPDTTWKSVFKLIVSFLYCTTVLFITSFVMVIVHDRVPDMYVIIIIRVKFDEK